jgi:hypothetical protein
VASECDDCSADGAFVDPARYYSLFSSVPLDGFAAFADNDHAFAITPPFEVCDTAFAFNADFCYPLTCVCVEDVDRTTAFSAGANETHPSPTGAEFEALHAPLIFSMSDNS